MSKWYLQIIVLDSGMIGQPHFFFFDVLQVFTGFFNSLSVNFFLNNFFSDFSAFFDCCITQVSCPIEVDLGNKNKVCSHETNGLTGRKTIVYLDQRSLPMIRFLKQKLHSFKCCHAFHKPHVFLVLNVSIKQTILLKGKCFAGTRDHTWSVWIQHWNINCSQRSKNFENFSDDCLTWFDFMVSGFN